MQAGICVHTSNSCLIRLCISAPLNLYRTSMRPAKSCCGQFARPLVTETELKDNSTKHLAAHLNIVENQIQVSALRQVHVGAAGGRGVRVGRDALPRALRRGGASSQLRLFGIGMS